MSYSKECPYCGEGLRLDEAAHAAHCDACGSELAPEELRVQTEEEVQSLLGASAKAETDCGGFVCANCGAQLIADEAVGSAFCCFCGAPAVEPELIRGAVEPDLILPFAVDRREAQDRFVRWFGAKKLVLPGFLETAKAGKISGVYVPFWLFDCTLETNVHAVSSVTETIRTEKNETVTAKRFHHYRRLTARYEAAPANASERIDGRLTDLLGPFDLSALEPIAPALLEGFYSEKNSFTAPQAFERVRERFEAEALRAAREALNTESYAEVKTCRHRYQKLDAKYALLPVWLMNYNFNGYTYQFFMNGQTGKIVGEAPVNLIRTLRWFGGVAAAVAAAGEAIYFVVNTLR